MDRAQQEATGTATNILACYPQSQAHTKAPETPNPTIMPQYVPHKSGVYLLHMDQPHYHAQHYLGWSKDVDTRLMHHWQCAGCTWCANFPHKMRSLGHVWELARVWPNVPKEYERTLKNRHNGRKLCPICNPKGPLGTDPYILVPEYINQLIPDIICPF